MTTLLQPIAANLIEEDAGVVYLVGGRRKSDGKIVFPLPSDAEAAHFDRIRLSPEGTLWSFTLQRFRPKSPPYAGRESEAEFKPYAVGYVELPGQVIVESRLEADDLADLEIGMPMRLSAAAFDHVDGETLIYSFRPAQPSQGVSEHD